MPATNAVHERWSLAKDELTAAQAAAVILTAGALGFALLLIQEPTAHEAMHSFRHAAGIVCH
ncbi:CbtB domain-containing protein [Halobaculum gomorrense]|uniref:Probable cobalt transporter subunit (CbtB) n=1 Tax=Halobaculum gomorrense TaxID=43928 RepID=A0A1M5PHB6_9EURY|nr:CbtB domain-containing protein [Halobaculum gomorrense]SHH01165.1 Probable cobalt transporter subunit (CbtB) [Halobaculum gomorrense]